MKRTRIQALPFSVPAELARLIGSADLYDSSCSPEARVVFIDRDGGYYLKSAPLGTLAKEAEMTAYFHKKGLGVAVLYYGQYETDLLLSAAARGEDCTHARYLAEPVRLCDTLAERLRTLHELDARDCPVQDRMTDYLALAHTNFCTGNYDKTQFPDSFGYRSAADAMAVLRNGQSALKNEVLLHGDYCLPNILLDDWRFSAFIDLGNGGVGDRHVDLFWGTWTLWFNLKTNCYQDRFLDAYGRDVIDEELLRVVAAAEVFG